MKTTSIRQTLKVSEINLHIDRMQQIFEHLTRAETDLRRAIRETDLDDIDKLNATKRIETINHHYLTADGLLNQLRNMINPF